MPLVHELYGKVVLEEVIFLQLVEDLILVDKLIKWSHFPISDHAVLTDCNIINPLFLLITHLKLINADDLHIQELLTL